MSGYRKSDLNAFVRIEDWQKSSGGNTCKAKRVRDEAIVFIKQYTSLKEPIHDSSTSQALYEKKMEKFERLVQIRSKVNQLMREVSGRGGNIIIPYEEFVCDHLYTEVSEFIPGLMPPEKILALSDKEKLQFIMTAVNALSVVHDKHVIHIDIKPANVIAVLNAYDKSKTMAVAKIIDFDNSLLSDLPVPFETGGDQIYQSPELAYYNDSEGDPEAAKLISEKTDIFSMGLTMHYYLSGGKLPGYTSIAEPGMRKRIEEKERKGKLVYSWEVLLGDGSLVMDSSLPKPIADIIEKMTVCEPEKRPSCKEVFSLLSSVLSHGGKKVEDRFDPPRSSDAITWNLDKLRADGYTGIHYSPSMRGYELTKNAEVIKRMDVFKLKSMGYAAEEVIPDAFDAPASKDGITWDTERLKHMGYTGIHIMPDGKYSITQDGRSMMTCDVSYLIDHQFAKRVDSPAPPHRTPAPEPSPKPAPAPVNGFDEPDANDGILCWDIDRLRRRGYTGIQSLGDGQYALISDGKQRGIYKASRLIQLKHAIPGRKKEEDSFETPDPEDGIVSWNEEKLRGRGYTGIHAIGGGKYILIMNGRSQGEYSKEKLIRLGYALI